MCVFNESVRESVYVGIHSDKVEVEVEKEKKTHNKKSAVNRISIHRSSLTSIVRMVEQ